MYTLRLLGGFALLGPQGKPVDGPAQRRVEAVLALLALAGDLRCTRDRLIGLLWPESDKHHARHSLRNALHAIRAVVGPEAVLVRGDSLELNPAVVDADVQQFSRALAESRFAEAVYVYRGSLLDGFHVDDAPEFERWLDGERARLYRECAGALDTLARATDGQSGPYGGAAWWARAADHDPHNSRVALRLIRALVVLGNSANARLCVEAHRRRLRRDLEIEPDAQFEEEVARLGLEPAPHHLTADGPDAGRPGEPA